jgi:hypothetical protein
MVVTNKVLKEGWGVMEDQRNCSLIPQCGLWRWLLYCYGDKLGDDIKRAVPIAVILVGSIFYSRIIYKCRVNITF